MRYFVTGATGFIGKRLVQKLLQRKGSVVYCKICGSFATPAPPG